MREGKWRHRVAYEEPAFSTDSFGQQLAVEPWPILGRYWAEVFQIEGKETRIAEQLQGVATHRVTMRYVGPISVGGRFDFKGRKLNILSVNPDPKTRYYEILCQEVVLGS
jgi:SPP1 family predicted phage head-tail adaptor